MASSDAAEGARAAFVDDDFELAVDLYSQAIKLDPRINACLFADRAQAYIKLNNFAEAVADSNRAIEMDSLMGKAYLRKGTACIKLEEYQTAKAALLTGASLVQNDSRFAKLIKECDNHIAEVAGNANGSLKPNLPDIAVQTSIESVASNGTTGNLGKLGQGNESNQKNDELTKPRYRHSFYQRPEEVVVTIFAKGIPANSVMIEFGEQILNVSIHITGEQAYRFQPRLFGKIVPDKCKYEVQSTKVEIWLAKAEIINWPALEYSQEIAVKQVYASVVGSGRPLYPSSKRRLNDWDKLEAQVKKEEKEEKLDGDAAVNKIFGEIYQNADEDMRRAMTKSFYESNGTMLSTNWQDVGAKKIEGSSPDGMQLKKWEY